MAALRSRCGHYISALWFLSSIFFFSRLISAVADWMSPILAHMCGLSANLRCRCETCCTALAANTGRKKASKNRHLGTIAQVCWAMSLQLRHVSTIGKKLIKQQYLPHTFPQYGKLRPTSGWDRSGSLGHPCKFQRVSRLGSVTARQSSIGRQRNFAASNRRRHLYSAGWPSRWALAHILVCFYFGNSPCDCPFSALTVGWIRTSDLKRLFHLSQRYSFGPGSAWCNSTS